MARGQRKAELPQGSRLLAALVYLVLLTLLARYLNGSYLPPFGLDGIWFYAAFATLLLSVMLLEPYYTAPKEALANGVAVLLLAASIAQTGAEVTPAIFRAGRYTFIGLASVIIFLAILAMALKGTTGFSGTMGRASTRAVESLGSARTLFSLVLIAAGLAAFSGDSLRVAALLLSWYVIIELEPIESLILLRRHRHPTRQVAGSVIGSEDPGVLIVRMESQDRVKIGRRVSAGNPPQKGTIVDFTVSQAQPVARVALDDSSAPVPVDAAVSLGEEVLDVVGQAGPGTTSEELVIEGTSALSESGIREGRLLQVHLRDGNALYQVTRAEIVGRQESGLPRRLIRVIARKLGTWSSQETIFKPVPWVPDPGTQVELLKGEGLRFDSAMIGHIPDTAYGISINEHLAITHNTAILGILGIGKTHLAWELVRRIISQGIRVVALDITGRYARHFTDLCSPATQAGFENAIERRSLDDLRNYDVRDGEAGNVREFTEALRTALRDFLEGQGMLLILNPNRFRVTCMEGRPFDQRANKLHELTMADVTSIVSEELLILVQRIDAEAREEDEATAPEGERARLCLVLEEAHALVPEWNSVAVEQERTSVSRTAQAILQGRKYGFGCLLITQRTANVTKSILNQSNTVFCLRNYDATGAGFLEHYVGPTYSGLIASLEDREAIVFGRASSCNTPLVIRLNESKHFLAGYWSERAEDIPPTLPPAPEDDAWIPSDDEPPEVESPDDRIDFDH